MKTQTTIFIGLLTLVAIFTGACGGDSVAEPQCESAEQIEADGETYCLYESRSPIIETGFSCPQSKAYHGSYGDQRVCGPENKVGEPLPSKVWDSLNERVDDDYIAAEGCRDKLCEEQKFCTSSGDCEKISEDRSCEIECAGGVPDKQDDTEKVCATDGESNEMRDKCAVECSDNLERVEGPNTQCPAPNPTPECEAGSDNSCGPQQECVEGSCVDTETVELDVKFHKTLCNRSPNPTAPSFKSCFLTKPAGTDEAYKPNLRGIEDFDYKWGRRYTITAKKPTVAEDFGGPLPPYVHLETHSKSKVATDTEFTISVTEKQLSRIHNQDQTEFGGKALEQTEKGNWVFAGKQFDIKYAPVMLNRLEQALRQKPGFELTFAFRESFDNSLRLVKIDGVQIKFAGHKQPHDPTITNTTLAGASPLLCPDMELATQDRESSNFQPKPLCGELAEASYTWGGTSSGPVTVTAPRDIESIDSPKYRDFLPTYTLNYEIPDETKAFASGEKFNYRVGPRPPVAPDSRTLENTALIRDGEDAWKEFVDGQPIRPATGMNIASIEGRLDQLVTTDKDFDILFAFPQSPAEPIILAGVEVPDQNSDDNGNGGECNSTDDCASGEACIDNICQSTSNNSNNDNGSSDDSNNDNGGNDNNTNSCQVDADCDVGEACVDNVCKDQ